MDKSGAMLESWHAYSCNLGELYGRETQSEDMQPNMDKSWSHGTRTGVTWGYCMGERHGQERGNA